MDKPQLPTPSVNPFLLLDRCADFYQEIANIKAAQAEGRLAAYLAPNEAQKLTSPSDFAERISARLANMLRQQYRDFQRDGAANQRQIHSAIVYLMTALADEVFILELDWPGRDAWLNVLLEQKLFKTNNAGVHFFKMAQQLIKSHKRNALTRELAAVFLMALAMGFKGCYRGGQGQISLLRVRKQLYEMLRDKSFPVEPPKGSRPWPAFVQAYQFLLHTGKDERLAPASPWKNLSLYTLASYLMLSLVAWLLLMHPFEKYISH